jgi:hypothetical protein
VYYRSEVGNSAKIIAFDFSRLWNRNADSASTGRFARWIRD